MLEKAKKWGTTVPTCLEKSVCSNCGFSNVDNKRYIFLIIRVKPGEFIGIL